MINYNQVIALYSSPPLYGSNKAIGDNRVTNITGVIWSCRWQVYRSAVYKDNTRINLGSTPDFFEACCYRKSGENKYNVKSKREKARDRYNLVSALGKDNTIMSRKQLIIKYKLSTETIRKRLIEFNKRSK